MSDQSAALVLLTSWDTAIHGSTTVPTRDIIKDLKEKTLKSENISVFYYTTLEVEVSEEQKKDAESACVTLIPATKNKWLDPVEDPPGVNWFCNLSIYFPDLKELQNIKHVVGYSPITQNAAVAIHQSLFPEAKLHQLSLPEPPAAALLLLPTWDTTSAGQITKPSHMLVNEFREKTKSEKVSKFYCTSLQDELSEEQKKDAESVRVTLIPALRNRWLDPQKDTPGEHWLFNHWVYFPGLKRLQNVKHVVGYSPKTQNAAAAIHDGLFPEAKLHQLHLPEPPPGVLFVYNEWNKEDCGLTGFHRTIVQEFCARKVKDGRAYSTLVGVKVSDDQKADAAKCGLTLIAAQQPEDGTEPEEDQPHLKWLMYHDIYYPDLRKLVNIKYVVGYAPRTGFAAVNIRKKVFPDAELVMINHAYKQHNCLLNIAKEKFSEMMLKLASESDIIFSIGPSMHEHFKNKYRATFEGRELHMIPHEEIFPRPAEVFFKKDPKFLEGVTTHSILTYGQIDTQEALDRCETLTASIGSVANMLKDFYIKYLEWSIQGCSPQAGEAELKRLLNQLHSCHVMADLHPEYTETSLLIVLHQCHSCFLAPCYKDYPLCGLEAVAVGLPTFTHEYSHLGELLNKYFPYHADSFVVSGSPDKISEKIIWVIKNTRLAFDKAKELKKALLESEDVDRSYGIFASLLTPDQRSKDEDGLAQCSKDITNPADHHADTTISIHVRLDENAYRQHLAESEGQNVGRQQAAWNNCKQQLKRRASDVVSNGDDTEKVKKVCTENLGEVDIKSMKTGCLQITVNMRRLYNLYRLRGSCLEDSRSLATALEPILMTDEMTEANTAGIPLQLIATYDQARFHELELFFLNRDGGGIGPVVCDDSIDEEYVDQILAQNDRTRLTLQREVTGKDSDIEHTGLKQSETLSRLLFLEIDPTREIQKSADKYAPLILNSEQCKRQKGRQCDIIQLTVKMTEKVQHILSHRPQVLELLGVRRYLMTDTERTDFSDSELEEKVTQHGRPIHPIPSVSISLQTKSLLPFEASPEQLKEIHSLQAEKMGLKHLLDGALTEKSQIQTESVENMRRLVKGNTELQTEKLILENRLEEALQEKSLIEKQYKQKLASVEKVAATQLMDVISLKQRLEELDHTIIQELESKLEQKEKNIIELETKLSELSAKLTDTEHKLKVTEALKPGQKYMAMETEKGHWSVRILDGQSPKPGRKFNRPRRMVFHGDQLVVCDSGNSIVQILNQDYTCDKVLGSFDGQFANPFRPVAAVVSHDNLYFINDGGNSQIVVCDQSNTILRIITLPAGVDAYSIALLNEFVLVTEVKGHRLLKLNQDGECVAEVGGRGHGQTQFNEPLFVVVNSKNVIMVSDRCNHCIKCFDPELQFLYQFGVKGSGPGQLLRPLCIDVDDDDNLYVCDRVNDRIVKWTCDGEWIYQLFEGEVTYPWDLAVSRDRIAVTEDSSNEIKVFYKQT